MSQSLHSAFRMMTMRRRVLFFRSYKNLIFVNMCFRSNSPPVLGGCAIYCLGSDGDPSLELAIHTML